MSELVFLYGKKESIVALTVPCLVTAQSCMYTERKKVEEGDLFLVGQWDTGATQTLASRGIIEALGLEPIGRKVNICGVNGKYESDTYLVDLHLPNGIVINDIVIAEMNDEFGPTVLIGLDVILHSDFVIGSQVGKAILKFRYPCEGDKPFSAEAIEFPDN